ncbi:transcription termination factor NusA, partial [Treponema sp. R6D11]
TQSIRAKEKEQLFEEFAELVGQVVPGEVLRSENGNLIVKIGKKEVLLPKNEQIKNESFVRGDRIRVVVVSVGDEKRTNGMSIYTSRTHPDMVRALLSREVPEVKNGVVKIEAVSREAGVKTKIAVSSNDPNVDPRGACIGANGSRIIPISNELSGEKMDIIKYSDDPVEFISAALAPAEIERIEIVGENEAKAYVRSDMLSLAIGGGGQNVRLAARLTGHKIDLIEIDENGNIIEKQEKTDE